MARKYNPKEIEPKWQERWAQDALYKFDPVADKPKWYFLTMFPYPSGALHIGHWFMYAPPDAKARYLRMKGHNVFFPMGFDAFGLPAENAAIKHGLDPKSWTLDNMAYMRNQFRTMGASYHWDHEVVTCDPDYYKWTQWLFIQFFKHGLAYRKKAPVDWCPKCNTSLAREQVKGDDRRCDRCQTQVTKKDLDQWLFRITKYADELLDFSTIQWPERVRTLQTEWIGRSEGAQITFRIDGEDDTVTVFTTRPDTVFGATFLVLAPEHPLVARVTTPERRRVVEEYVEQTKRIAEIDRLATTREKTGAFTGAYALHPFTGAKVPIWIADYVLMNYGTGAIMSVPAHDERDFAFASKYGLPITVVISPEGWDGEPLITAYTEPGLMVNSGEFNGLQSEEGKTAVIKALEASGQGKAAVTYRLHDWLISRQRYWGAPIPMIHCKCGTHPVPEEQLPVLLPEGVQFLPTGESPLKLSEEFRRTTCPICGGEAERDTDTMDTFVDSSWYWFRYLNPRLEDRWIDSERAERWLPVDEYAGGIEHATMHLLYARFFTKALRDMGFVKHSEPFTRLFNQGLMLGEDGQKMSKSRPESVINPGDQVEIYGTDVFRTYLMFIGPWDAGGPWSSKGIEGVNRFYKKLWNFVLEPAVIVSGESAAEDLKQLKRQIHKTIARVGHDLEHFRFNTAVARLMEYLNYLVKAKETALVNTPEWAEAVKTLVLLIAPIGPHIAEELWQELGCAYSVHQQAWPEFDPALAADDLFTLVVQINGKVRERIGDISVDISDEDAKKTALNHPNIQKQIADKEIINLVYVPKRLINIVVR